MCSSVSSVVNQTSVQKKAPPQRSLFNSNLISLSSSLVCHHERSEGPMQSLRSSNECRRPDYYQPCSRYDQEPPATSFSDEPAHQRHDRKGQIVFSPGRCHQGFLPIQQMFLFQIEHHPNLASSGNQCRSQTCCDHEAAISIGALSLGSKQPSRPTAKNDKQCRKKEQ